MSQGGVASRGTALVAGGLVVVLLAVGWPLSAMAHQLNVSNDGPDILILAGAAVGVIVAWHQPRNPMAGYCSPPGMHRAQQRRLVLLGG